MKYNAILGGALSIALMAASAAHLVHLSIIELLFLLGPLVVVPLGLELCVRLNHPETLGLRKGTLQVVEFLAGLSATVSFFRQPGKAAVLLALPWFCFGCFLALAGLTTIIRLGISELKRACVAVSFLYLPVGCAWLLASRLGITPMAFQEPIVLLTAVHFHFAGFAAPLLLLAASSVIQKGTFAARRILPVIASGVLAGPGLLAAGFVIGPRFKLAMALLIACSEIGLSLFFLASIQYLRPRLAQVLVSVSAVSVSAAMILAAVWAIGEFPLRPFVHLDEMAKLHGTANGFGFVICGLVGWTLATHERSSRRDES